MPVVDILSIAPPSDKTDTVAFGGDEITVHPLTISQIARIAQRFAGLAARRIVPSLGTGASRVITV